MNNKEVFEKFKSIAQNSNPLDCIIALKQFKKQYKKSNFYKSTHLNIFAAYKACTNVSLASLALTVNELLQSDNLATYLNDMMASVDLNILLNQILYGINYDMVLETVQKFLPNITMEDLNSLTSQLQQAVEQFRK